MQATLVSFTNFLTSVLDVTADVLTRPDGSVVSKIDDKMQCWAIPFSQLMNASDQLQPDLDLLHLNPLHQCLDSDTKHPPVNEILAAVKR